MNDTSDLINIAVTFRHTESTPALKQHAIDKITKVVNKFINDEAEVHVVLEVEKRDHIAEVEVRSKNYNVTAKTKTVDLYSSIDKVVDAIDAQLRKQKEIMVEHHKHQPSI